VRERPEFGEEVRKIMPLVPKAERLDALRRLGLSEPVLQQASGKSLHKFFKYIFTKPYEIYYGAVVPDGPPLIPIYTNEGQETAAWVRNGRLEFITFHLEDDPPGEYRVVAHTEQGMLAEFFLYWLCTETQDLSDESRKSRAEMAAAAQMIGFLYFGELVRACLASDHLGFKETQAFKRKLVAQIDRSERRRASGRS
jgi:hypothetical protein